MFLNSNMLPAVKKSRPLLLGVGGMLMMLLLLFLVWAAMSQLTIAVAAVILGHVSNHVSRSQVSSNVSSDDSGH